MLVRNQLDLINIGRGIFASLLNVMMVLHLSTNGSLQLIMWTSVYSSNTDHSFLDC